MTPASELYPAYCSSLAPTTRTYCLMYATAIHALDFHPGYEGQGIFHHRNLPIHWARIVGAVVAIDDFAGRRVYTIDDSSGACIECNVGVAVVKSQATSDGAAHTYDLSPPRMEFKVPSCESIDVGHIVDIKGTLSTFRNEMNIQIQKANILRSTQDELNLWNRRTVVQRDILDQPWVLSEKQIRRCRRLAEKEAGGKKGNTQAQRTQQTTVADRGSKAAAARTAQDPPNPAEALDGFGRPLKKRSSAKARFEQPESSSSSVEKLAREAPAVELDGFGRPKKLRGPTSRDSAKVHFKPPQPSSAERSARETSAVELDGFGRPKKFRGLPSRDSKVAGASQGPGLVLDESVRGKYSALGL